MKREWPVYVGAAIFTVMMILALQRGFPVDTLSADEARQAFLRDHPDIDQLHHKVWQKVGEDRWEAEVKPAILRDLTVGTIRETGNPFPALQDVVDWAHTHPDEARGIFERYLREPEE